VDDATPDTFVLSEHAAPGGGHSMLISTEGTKNGKGAPQLSSRIHPIGWQVAFLVPQALRVRSGEGRGFTTEIIRLTLIMVVGEGTRSGQRRGFWRDDAEGHHSRSDFAHGQTCEVEGLQGDYLGGCDLEREHVERVCTLVYLSLKDDPLRLPLLFPPKLLVERREGIIIGRGCQEQDPILNPLPIPFPEGF
jgi:hypothetical protein